MKYVLVVGDGKQCYYPFAKFGKFSCEYKLLNNPNNQIALVVFTGGCDISPVLYGQTESRLTFCNPKRDVFELIAFRRAKKHNLPIVGICRGAQFLCAMAGGTLYQHVNGHMFSRHDIETWDGRVFEVNSTHHQMQNPPPSAKILAWSKIRLSDEYIGQRNEELFPPNKEYECVYYPQINAVGIQYHPEAMNETSEGFQFAEELVEKFLKF